MLYSSVLLHMRTYLNSSLFLCSILLFFMPFLELRCTDGSRFAKMNGFDLAFARGVQFESEESVAYFSENPQMIEKIREQNRPDLFTILTLVMLFAGIIIQFIPRIKNALFSVLLALCGITLLSVLMFMVNYLWDKQTASFRENPFFGKMFNIQLAFGNGIWLVIFTCTLIVLLNVVFLINDRKNAHLDVYYPEDNQ